MKTPKYNLIIGAALAAVLLAAAPGGAQQQVPPPVGGISSQTIDGGSVSIRVGESHIFTDVERFAVTNPELLGAELAPDFRLVLQAQKAGSTSVQIQKRGMAGFISYRFEISGVDVENVLKELRRALGNIIGLQIRREGNVVVLEGNVENLNDGHRIDRQIQFFGETILDLTNRLYMDRDLESLRRELAVKYPTISAEISRRPRDNQPILRLTGSVHSDLQKIDVLKIADRFFDEEAVIDQIDVVFPQIEIDIESYAIDATRTRAIGSNTLWNQITTVIMEGGWQFASGPNGGTTGYPTFTIAPEARASIVANNLEGAVTDLAKQHLSVRSGETGTLDNTQERFIRIEGSLAAELEKVTAGQIISITPIYAGDGKFDTRVSVEVSQFSNIAAADDDVAVAVDKRKLESTFVSGQGQTVVLGGTRVKSALETEDSTPFLSRIPIINLFFKGTVKQSQDIVQAYFMTLHAPNVYNATEPAWSRESPAEKDSITKQTDEGQEFLKRRQKVE